MCSIGPGNNAAHVPVSIAEQSGRQNLPPEQVGAAAIVMTSNKGADAMVTSPQQGADAMVTSPKQGADAMVTSPQQGGAECRKMV